MGRPFADQCARQVRAIAEMKCDWLTLSTVELNAQLAKAPIVLLPIGAIEAHGPHLPVGTDVFLAESLAERLAIRLAKGTLVLPSIRYSVAEFADAFVGTISIPFEVAKKQLESVVDRVRKSGARQIVFVNAHLDPAHRQVLLEVAQAHPDILFPDIVRRRFASRLGDEFQSGACHAGQYESSMMLSLRPDLVDMNRMLALSENDSSLSDAIRDGKLTFAEAGGKDAYFGAPAKSTAEFGEQLLDELVAIHMEVIAEAPESNR